VVDTGLPVTSVPPGPTKTDIAPMQAGIADSQPVPVPTDAWTPQVVAQPEQREPHIAPTSAPQPRAEPPQEQPARQAVPAAHMPQIPPVALTLSADSGLEMVETKHHAESTPQTESEPARPRRVRPARVVVEEEPLQMVETRHDQQPPAAQ